jgi:hypothetical protein
VSLNWRSNSSGLMRRSGLSYWSSSPVMSAKSVGISGCAVGVPVDVPSAVL